MKSSVLIRVAVCVLAAGAMASAQALKKDDPTSHSGHGQGRDVWLIKGTDTVAKCGGPVGSQVNPAGGALVSVCRVDGVVREVAKAPPKKGG